MELAKLLRLARKARASDVHIIAGVPPAFRVDGEIIMANAPPLGRDDTKRMVYSILNDEQRAVLEKEWELCISVYDPEAGRLRVNVYYQNANPELAIRMCNQVVQSAQELGLPPVVDELTRKESGLIIVTGPAGVGKTTTMNYMIDVINRERRRKIVMIEDPVEFTHRPKRSLIVQLEVHTDTHSFAGALRHALRMDPDVIAVGEMRDLETMSTALSAAETGHLVIATLHTPNTMQTVDRMVSVFPSHQQNQVTIQLANALEAVIAQRLLPRAGGKGRVLATEILLANAAVRKLIRENAAFKLYSVLQTSRKEGMYTVDASLLELYEKGAITYDTAVTYADNPGAIKKAQESHVDSA